MDSHDYDSSWCAVHDCGGHKQTNAELGEQQISVHADILSDTSVAEFDGNSEISRGQVCSVTLHKGLCFERHHSQKYYYQLIVHKKTERAICKWKNAFAEGE
jgi:hypothetical protein